MAVHIGCIVEGHGEVSAVPALIRRIAEELAPGLAVVIPRPLRITKSKLLRPMELERAASLAANNISGRGGLLLLLDSDEDCPAEMGPSLRQRMQAARQDLPCAVVLAKQEFESWFLASAESLGGPAELTSPADPEGIRGAKEWLRNHWGMYAPTVNQTSLTYAMDFTRARQAQSFDRCYREITRLLEAARRLPEGSYPS
jgi:hypothetical protein